MNDISAPAVGLLLGELTQRLHRFFHALDERRYDDMLALFTADGRWLRQGQWLEDHAAMRGALAARPALQRVRHVISNAYVAEAGTDAARVEAYMTAYRFEGVAPGVPILRGPFRLNLVTTLFQRQGADWLIAEQRLLPEFEFAA